MSKIDIVPYALNKNKVEGIVEKQAKERNEIIYGRKALNKQLPGFVRANTKDFDIYDTQPSKAANLLDKKLDRCVGNRQNMFFVKAAQHEGTHKVMNVGADGKANTEDDIGIADFTKMPKSLKTIKHNGIRYESVSSIKKGKQKILKDKESKYRWEKDRGDLERIKARKLFGGW